MSTAAAIEARLTRAQRQALCPNDRQFAEEHKGKAYSRSIHTASVLNKLGLTDECRNLAVPTALGLEVREIIKASEKL